MPHSYPSFSFSLSALSPSVEMWAKVSTRERGAAFQYA